MTNAPVSRSSSGSEPVLDEGIDFALEQLCLVLGVDQNEVCWDAATETTDGDVRSVIGNIMRAKYGEDWGPNAVAQGSPDCGDNESRMETISALIARLQSTLDRWGDTCVYIRRGGLSWGAVALNRRSDDEKNGVFDLQAQHDRDMLERLEQIERLKKDRDEWRQKVWDAEAKASSVSSTPPKTAAPFDVGSYIDDNGDDGR